MEQFNWPEFYKYLFGTDNMAFVAAGFIFAMLGLALSAMARATAAKIELNAKSPNSFSLAFLIADKWIELLSSFIVTVVALRFASLWIPAEYILFGSFGIGLLNYQLLNYMIKWFTKLLPGYENN